jgi:hypothetical protein
MRYHKLGVGPPVRKGLARTVQMAGSQGAWYYRTNVRSYSSADIYPRCFFWYSVLPGMGQPL